MDPLDGGTQPHCPTCNVVMRDHQDGYQCPECEQLLDLSDELKAVKLPPGFDGPVIGDGWSLR